MQKILSITLLLQENISPKFCVYQDTTENYNTIREIEILYNVDIRAIIEFNSQITIWLIKPTFPNICRRETISIYIYLYFTGSNQKEHVFHLHGNQFYIIGSKIFHNRISKLEVIKMNVENRLIERNLKNPVLKDTVRIPKNGLVVLRFHATNPGKIFSQIFGSKLK